MFSRPSSRAVWLRKLGFFRGEFGPSVAFAEARNQTSKIETPRLLVFRAEAETLERNADPNDVTAVGDPSPGFPESVERWIKTSFTLGPECIVLHAEWID